MTYRWFLTPTSVREFGVIVGESDFERARERLGSLCETAKLATSEAHREIWRAGLIIRGKKTRIELTVALSDRAEGEKAQLVRVRNKGR